MAELGFELEWRIYIYYSHLDTLYEYIIFEINLKN